MKRNAHDLRCISKNPVYELAIAYQKTAALLAASRLNIFGLIGTASVSASDLAARACIPLKSIRALCDFLCVIGLLDKAQDAYTIPPSISTYVNPASGPTFLDCVEFLAAPEMMSLYLLKPEKYVKEGGAVGLGVISPKDLIWKKFAEAMIPFATQASRLTVSKVRSVVGEVSRVLDVAAGHGLYGIEFAKAFPCAEITAVDWPDVLRVARTQAEKALVSDRYITLPGDIFNVHLPECYDAILLPNILHHFGTASCKEILGKLRSSLAPKGILCIIDFMPDPVTLTPPEAVAFAFQMLATTPEGAAYTSDNYCEFASEAGLEKLHSSRLLPTPATLLVFGRAEAHS